MQDQTRPRHRAAYTAGPIRAVGIDKASTWRLLAGRFLADYGILVFNPVDAFIRPTHVDRGHCHAMETINRRAIDVCDVVFASLPAGTRGLGTIRELEYGVANGKRAIVITDDDLEGKVSAYDLEVYSTLAEALAAVVGDVTPAQVERELEGLEKQLKSDMEMTSRNGIHRPGIVNHGLPIIA